jgi:mRNA interferase RelE/StbE
VPGGYRVQTRPRVRKDLRKLDQAVRNGVLAALRALADDPRPAGGRPLKDHRPWLRIRAGDYRGHLHGG